MNYIKILAHAYIPTTRIHMRTDSAHNNAAGERVYPCPNAMPETDSSTTSTAPTITTVTDSNTIRQAKDNGAIIGGVSAAFIMLILFVVVTFLGSIIVYFVKKNKKRSQPSVTNAMVINNPAYSNTTIHNGKHAFYTTQKLVMIVLCSHQLFQGTPML